MLLIIANFESIPVRIGVNVPQHAFDFLQMPVMEKADYIRPSGIRRQDAETMFLEIKNSFAKNEMEHRETKAQNLIF